VTATAVTEALDRLWRAESASMLGVLARRLGDLDRAEEALQDAVAEALRRWPIVGVPTTPAGWLVTTAWRRAVDRLRRDAAGQEKLLLLGASPPAQPSDDDRLALIFACCHPDLPEQAQVALTLHAVSGLSTEQVAAAFVVPVPTMGQRLLRAKRRLRAAKVRFELPDRSEFGDRVPVLLAVVYLVFNEGYTTARAELGREGLELARQLATLLPSEPEAAGLAALVELHQARAAARFDPYGRIVLLEDQERGRWNRPLIVAATARLHAAAALNRPGPYQVQAAIAAQHALANSFEQTDWPTIRRLYDVLDALRPSPVARLNRAVATRYTLGPAAALAEVDELAEGLGEYGLLHATRGELLWALGRRDESRAETGRARAMATNPAERELLARRLGSRQDSALHHRTDLDAQRTAQ
jgi:RNA polymerase sigma factor (sigma-70 family)